FFDVKPEYETQRGISDGCQIISAYHEPPKVTNFQVFKLDTNKDPIQWQNVQLEDRVAFVSNLNSVLGMFCSTDSSFEYFPAETSKHDDDVPDWPV
ncbi:F-box protein, partial [Trifolium pratense]